MDTVEKASLAKSLVESVLLFLASVFLLWRGLHVELTSHRERAPTSINMATFARDYRGQRYLHLTGRLDRGRERWRYLDDKYGKSRDLWVPLAAPGAGPHDPVHAFVMFGPARTPEAERAVIAQLASAATAGVTGMRIDVMPPESLLGVAKADPCIVVQVGNEPDASGTGTLMALLGVFLIAVTTRMWFKLARVWRNP
jgi:hypothetical protein